ncbi:MAG: 2Fe-2S iron-sulfur cluster-binding protein [Alphaproteobacteria bacterium]
MPQMIFIKKNDTRRACDFAPGETILAVARRNGIDLEGACDGAMACSTCHVIVDKDWAARLPKARQEENDMLDLATGVTRHSRLGCQIILTDELNGLTVKLP